MSKLLGRPPKYPFASLVSGGGGVFTILPNDAPAGGLTSLQALARYHSRRLLAQGSQDRFVVEALAGGEDGFVVTRLPARSLHISTLHRIKIDVSL